MKSVLKAVIVLALFCGTALADGDMGNGGIWQGGGTGNSTPTANGGDMGNGGIVCPEGETCTGEPDGDPFSLLTFLSSFLDSGN
jgi:hypothetical protein